MDTLPVIFGYVPKYFYKSKVITIKHNINAVDMNRIKKKMISNLKS
jgi:hypothetical protein